MGKIHLVNVLGGEEPIKLDNPSLQPETRNIIHYGDSCLDKPHTHHKNVKAFTRGFVAVILNCRPKDC
jgi:hypothetical protein